VPADRVWAGSAVVPDKRSGGVPHIGDTQLVSLHQCQGAGGAALQQSVTPLRNSSAQFQKVPKSQLTRNQIMPQTVHQERGSSHGPSMDVGAAVLCLDMSKTLCAAKAQYSRRKTRMTYPALTLRGPVAGQTIWAVQRVGYLIPAGGRKTNNQHAVNEQQCLEHPCGRTLKISNIGCECAAALPCMQRH
jgi:hypothetical protein